MDDAELLRIGTATLLASFEAYARGAADARLHRLPGVAVAVFARGPEREVYNNAVLDLGLPARGRAAALAAAVDLYRSAGVERFAVWVHESDGAAPAEFERAGLVFDSATRAMGLPLDAAGPSAAREGGRIVATALAYDHRDDGGIVNVGTAEGSRRRGFGTAVTAAHLVAARGRGCRTASLQSTPMAQGLYAALGFRDLGRFLEFTPPSVTVPAS